MDRDIDPHLQSIIDNARGPHQEQRARGFNPQSSELSEWSFPPSSRHALPESDIFNEPGKSECSAILQDPSMLTKRSCHRGPSINFPLVLPTSTTSILCTKSSLSPSTKHLQPTGFRFKGTRKCRQPLCFSAGTTSQHLDRPSFLASTAS